MGKRKERRVAAASGRRVKLDLFAEPAGDLGGPSARAEVGSNGNSKNHAGSPNSPSSPGQPSENPLSLLGQYSDDDLDDESSELVNHTVVDTPLTDFNNQVNTAADKEREQNTGTNSSTNHDSLDIGQHSIQDGTASTEFLHELQEPSTVRNDSVTQCTDKETEEQHMSVNVAPDMQVNGDLCSGWKMVLHEESNQYYYWNTLTGETSWDVPDVLADLTSEVKNDNDANGTENAVVGIHESNSTPVVNPEVSVDTQSAVGLVFTDENCKMEEIPNLSSQMKVSDEDPSAMLKDNSAACDVNHKDKESPSLEKLEAKWSDAGAGSGGHIQNLMVLGEHESGTDLCSHISWLGESLLERLNTLKGSKGRLIGHDKISKYTVEVETRLSDINSLSMHASTLLPFWLHCEKKFKQLESAISDEVLQFYESVEMNALEANENNVVHSEEENTSHDASVAKEVLKEWHSEVDNSVAVKNNLLTSIVHANSPSDGNPEEKCEVQEAAVPDESTPMAMVHSEEDVDMELEDVVPASALTYSSLQQQPIWPNPAAEHEGAGIPPPPGDDWIPPPPPDDDPFPPPPPDNEPVPPPPPEAVPETFYPVPLPDPMMEPSFSYAAQYNVPYPGSSIEYYGQPNAEVQENTYYAPHPNQLSVPLPSYYEALPNAYPAAAPAPAVVNLGEHGSYYGLQDETAPPVPGVTGVQSSVLYFTASQGCLSSDKVKSNYNTVSTDGTDVPTVDTKSEKKSVPDSLASVSDQAAATISATQVSSISSIPDVPVAVAAAVPKAHSKVPRIKKRAASTVVSTLKSNKKVSSLVDKWKAAKEELHEEEDDPENAYEMLEKKRQREIEEWRAQQIASGEAKDNANFQPLGGDWRERVKRKRARLMKKSLEDLSENATNGNQQPNLDKLQKDLPSGWQVYWDDASKQVYYGNSVTSETTWIRPT